MAYDQASEGHDVDVSEVTDQDIAELSDLFYSGVHWDQLTELQQAKYNRYIELRDERERVS